MLYSLSKTITFDLWSPWAQTLTVLLFPVDAGSHRVQDTGLWHYQCWPHAYHKGNIKWRGNDLTWLECPPKFTSPQKNKHAQVSIIPPSPQKINKVIPHCRLFLSMKTENPNSNPEICSCWHKLNEAIFDVLIQTFEGIDHRLLGNTKKSNE